MAFIFGPAIGGILCQVSNHFPLFVAGGVSGVALVFALFFLKESSPEILAKRATKASAAAVKEVKPSPSETPEPCVAVKVKMLETVKSAEPVKSVAPRKAETVSPMKAETATKEAAKPKVHITPTMVICFCFEFCVRWDMNVFNSHYGIYLQDTFNTPSKLFSAVLVAGAVWNVFEQMLLYPFFVSKVGVPIPWLCFVGMRINAAGLVLMTAKKQTLSLATTLFFWIGYCFGSPSAASILTVSAEGAEG